MVGRSLIYAPSLHAGDDGLLSISDDRRRELQRLVDSFAAMRDLYLVWAVQDGALGGTAAALEGDSSRAKTPDSSA